jgi:hypothetical protein
VGEDELRAAAGAKYDPIVTILTNDLETQDIVKERPARREIR